MSKIDIFNDNSLKFSMDNEKHITVGWNANSWIPRAVKHILSDEPVLDDYTLERLGFLGEPVDLPVAHGILHAYSCTAHLLQSERLRFSYLRMLTVWYYGLDLKKSGPYNVVWEDRLPDERLQKGYDELCKRLVELYEEEFPPMYLPSGQSSFRWMGHYAEAPYLLAFMRENTNGEHLIFLINRGKDEIRDLDFGVPDAGDYEILLDTSMIQFVGGHADELIGFSSKNLPTKGFEHCLFIDMDPASAFILKKKTTDRDTEIEQLLKNLERGGGQKPPPEETEEDWVEV